MPIDPKTTALLLIEYQNDFTSKGGALALSLRAVSLYSGARRIP